VKLRIINQETGQGRDEEATPVCGEDFCERCGDCLVCFGGDECCEGGEHEWVRYEDGATEEVPEL